MFFGQQQSRTAGGDSALFYVVYLFRQAFEFFNMGYASAMAWLLFAGHRRHHARADSG